MRPCSTPLMLHQQAPAPLGMGTSKGMTKFELCPVVLSVPRRSEVLYNGHLYHRRSAPHKSRAARGVAFDGQGKGAPAATCSLVWRHTRVLPSEAATSGGRPHLSNIVPFDPHNGVSGGARRPSRPASSIAGGGGCLVGFSQQIGKLTCSSFGSDSLSRFPLVSHLAPSRKRPGSAPD
eukprot:gene7402-biopygen11422